MGVFLKFSIVGVGENITSIPYLYKLSNVLCELGKVDYICWDRNDYSNSLKFPKNIDRKCVLSFRTNNKYMLIIGYFFWFLSLLKYILIKGDSNRLYFASRLDAAGPLMLASLIRPSIKYVYLDRDAYHMTYKLGMFKGLVEKIETTVASRSVFHFIPGKSRNFTKKENVRVIENTPNKSFFIEAEAKSKILQRTEKFTIYVNGWLVDTRGAQAILKCASNLDKRKYQIIVAGPTQCVAIKELVKLPVVNYLGQLSNIDSLSYYFISDVVLSFYDPSIEINRKAEPNKWYDCVFTNTSFITNYGIETAKPFINCGLCYLINYDDDGALLRLIHDMNSHRKKYDEKEGKNDNKELLKQLGVDYWDEKVKNIIKN